MVAAFSSMKARAYDDHPDFTPAEIDAKLRHKFNNREIVQNISPSTHIYLGFDPLGDTTTDPLHTLEIWAATKRVVARQTGDRNVHLGLLKGGHIGWDARQIIDDTLNIYNERMRQNAEVGHHAGRHEDGVHL
jgi:hypothetical protein